MCANLPLTWPRAVTLLTSVCLLCTLGPAPRSAPFGHEGDAVGSWNGKPLPRPDSPEEAMGFRLRQWRDENGVYPANALVAAKAHVDRMRQHVHTGQMSAAAGVTNAGWTWLGPGNIGGRVRSLVIDPTNVNKMLAGSVGGGIFKTTDGGASWAPVDDFMANLAVSALVMQPGAPATIYAGTGEGFFNSDGLRGAGVFKSTDGGTTWQHLAATNNSDWFYVNRLAVSPDGLAIVAATRTGIYGSTNGGSNWTRRLASTSNGITDIEFHPTDSNRAVASGYAGNAYYSIDRGMTWLAATGLAAGTFRRVEIAYARSNPTIVYASEDVNSGTIYKSLDGGASYTAVSNPPQHYLGGQGWYDNALWVDPTNENSLVLGGIDLWKSTNGGASISQISRWQGAPASAHADHHAIVEQPGFNGSTNRTVFFTNDGGVYKTSNVNTVGGGNFPYTSGWTALNNNLGVTQFYGAGGHPATGVILGGTQDNGTLKYTPATGTTWTTEFGGDGGFSAVDQTNANHLFGEYVRLQLHRSLDGGANADWINGLYWTGSTNVCKPAPYTITDSCGSSLANFIAPFVLDPNDSNTLLAGGASLWRTTDASTPNTPSAGPTWANIKGPIGGGDNISAIGVAATDSSQIWVGHNSGALYKTTTGLTASPAWVRRGAGTLPPRWVMRVRVDPSDANTIYVGYGGFSTTNLWKSVDGGTTWFAASGTGLTALPAAPVRDIAVNPLTPSWLYAATEVGIFTSQDGGATWTVPHDGPANVSVEELFWMGSSLVAVTHGRGLFRTQPTGLTLPTISLSATSVAAGATVTATIANGPGTPGDWVGLFVEGAGDGSYLDWRYLNGTQSRPGSGVTGAAVAFTMPAVPGPYNVRLFRDDSLTRLETSATITVTAPTPSIALSATTVVAGGTVTATIANGPGKPGDWVGLFAGGAGDGTYLNWQYLNGTQSRPASGVTGAAVAFTMPAVQGPYNVRLFRDDSLTRLATSATITVTAPTPSIALSTTTVAPGGTVTATIANGPGTRGDWIGMFAEGAGDGSYLDWRYLNGTQSRPGSGVTGAAVAFTMPAVPGPYNVRLFRDDSLTRLATSATITVTAPTPSIALSATSVTNGASVTATIADGPGNAGDWVGLFAEGAGDGGYLDWKYLNGTQTRGTGLAPVPFTLAAPGTYNVRLFLNDSLSRLATSLTITVQ